MWSNGSLDLIFPVGVEDAHSFSRLCHTNLKDCHHRSLAIQSSEISLEGNRVEHSGIALANRILSLTPRPGFHTLQTDPAKRVAWSDRDLEVNSFELVTLLSRHLDEFRDPLASGCGWSSTTTLC